MSKKIRSARGSSVDFDLLKMKQQISAAPPPMDVRTRQDFIEKRMRRRVRKVAPPAPKIEQVEGEPAMPDAPAVAEQVMIEPTAPDTSTARATEEKPATKKKYTRKSSSQKARPATDAE